MFFIYILDSIKKSLKNKKSLLLREEEIYDNRFFLILNYNFSGQKNGEREHQSVLHMISDINVFQLRSMSVISQSSLNVSLVSTVYQRVYQYFLVLFSLLSVHGIKVMLSNEMLSLIRCFVNVEIFLEFQ
jgi:hypothetical protein